MKGDRALREGDVDRLGFREVATRIATALIDHRSDGGLVVGLEGRWGSGKSSLLYLIQDELGRLPTLQRPTVIKFQPWLIGNRDALLANLFQELATAIDKIQAERGDATGETVTKAKKAAEAVRAFAAGLGKAGELIEFAGGATSFVPLSWLGKGVKVIGNLAKEKPEEKSLAALKNKLTQALRDLGHRFIVTIDDVDRLEPSEAIEVLRLARSVADFPNVIYLLCYDSQILAHSVQQAANVKNGQSFLEKIVQLTIMVPQPESFQLQHWFAEELHEFAVSLTEDGVQRLRSVIDMEGGKHLLTPRSVNRALDSIRFLWPPLREAKADLADLVWLQIIKDGNPKLYRWIENYSAVAAALSLGTARVDDEGRGTQLSGLLDAAGEGYFKGVDYRHNFAGQLPGMEMNYDKDAPPFILFGRMSPRERDAAIRDKRLASPDHYRLYFALSTPSHALVQNDFDRFWAAAEHSSEDVVQFLLGLHLRSQDGSLGKADLLLERIHTIDPKLLSPTQCKNILLAFANCLDDAYRQRPFARFWITSLWDRAERFLPILISKLADRERKNTLDAMFAQGKALSWLTGLYRSETFSHGRYGDRKKPSSEWLFNADEFDRISDTMTARYRSMTLDQISDSIDPITILFAWSQGGDKEGPRDMIASKIQSDDNFLKIMNIMATEITTSSSRYRALKKDHLEPFIDFDTSRIRADYLHNHASDPSIKARAEEISKFFSTGDHF